MPEIRAIFWDVGGVLLSNAWDSSQRRRTLEHFSLNESEFQERHEMVVSSFERGKITLKEYLSCTVFYRPRPFSEADFRKFMFSLSQPNEEALALARGLGRTGRYLMSTINNESKELNQYRIDTFSLKEIFTLFVSSCYVSLRKPEEGIYRVALDVRQVPPAQCCFIDDRLLNLDSAKAMGMHTIHMENAAQLRQDLQTLGVQT